MSVKKYRVAIVGATGAVGQTLLELMIEREFPVSDLIPFASARSLGKQVKLGERGFACQVLKPGCFEGVDFAFFDASDAISKEWVQEAARAGAWVIDNSATYRMDKQVPLVVPEINGSLIAQQMNQGRIFAGPNCSTVQMVVALKPLSDLWGLKRVVVSTYQSASGAGAAAMEELKAQVQELHHQRAIQPRAFVHPIAFNCIPQIGGFKEDGYTGEEQKIMAEARKILNLPDLRINATAIRVPTLSCHGESINVECNHPFSMHEVFEAFRAQEGLVLLDKPSENIYPMSIYSVGKDPVFVGRIRKDDSVEHGLSFWVVSDNLRKGAALNAIQIGECISRAMQ